MTSVPVDRLVVALEERRAVLIDVIRRARREITLSLFRCNDEEIFDELAAATARGVDVDVLVTSRSKGGPRRRQKLWDGLERTGASVHAYSDPVVKYHAKYLLADEGPAHSLAIMTQVASRSANIRKMAWLMPRMAKAVPYLGYVLVASEKPR